MSIFKAITDGFKDGLAAGVGPNTPKTTKQNTSEIAVYEVVYKGGVLEYPKEKAGAIGLKLLADKFELVPTLGTRSWFKGVLIPYPNVTDVRITNRTVSTLEGILGGLDSRQLNQANNIHITFRSPPGHELTLRLEMLSGITVMGQASRCLELMDRLKAHGIIDQFQAPKPKTTPTERTPDMIDQLEKLAGLRDKGIISSDEFESKKKDFLSRM